MKKALFTLLCTFLMFAAKTSSASHCAGGELTYEYVNSNTWKFTFKFYRDCSGIGAPPSFTMCYLNTCNNTSSSVTLSSITTLPDGTPNGTPVNTGCSAKTKCDSAASTIPGFEEWWYEGQVTLSNACVDYVFWISEAARNTQYNLTGGNMHIEAHLDNFNVIGNNSPTFIFKPVPYLCVNQFFTYNNGGFDVDGDSLVYSSIQPLTSAGTAGGSCTYGPSNVGITAAMTALGYNPINNPLPSTLFGVNPATGLVQVNPNLISLNTITILVEEYRNGLKIGSVMRDIQIATVPCQVVTPVSNLNPNTLENLQFDINTFYYNGCPNDTVNFCLEITGAIDTALLVAISNSPLVLPGSVLNITGQGSDTVQVCLSWFPTSLDTGLHVVTIQYRDTNCLYNAVSTPASFSLPIYIIPFVEAFKDTTLCEGDTALLSAVGGNLFNWEAIPIGTNNTSLSALTGQSVQAWPTTTTSYLLTSNLGNLQCSDNLDTVTVTVIPKPSVSLGPDLTTCFNSNVPIAPTVTPGTFNYNYLWSPGTFLTNPVTSLNQVVNNPTASTTTYTFSAYSTALGQNRCVARDTITVNSLLGAQVLNGDTMICQGQSVSAITFGSALYNYTWTPAAGAGISNTNISNPTITPPGTSGTTNYVMTASYPGCPDVIDNFNITIQPNPIVSAGTSYTMCFGDTLHLAASCGPAAPAGTYTYLWAPAADLDDANSLTPIFDGTSSTLLSFTASTSIGCTATDTMYIEVIPVDFLNITADQGTCPNGTVTFNASGAVSYAWTPGIWVSDSTSANINAFPISTTTLTLIGLDLNGCRDTAYRVVTVYENAVINLADNYTIYPGESVTLYASGNCNLFTWAPSNGLSATNVMDPTAQPNVSTQYVVSGITEYGCTVTDTVTVNVMPNSVLALPNAFTPGNGTGINDEFKVDRLGLASLNYFRIFDRWGQLMYEGNDINRGWNGTFKEKPQPMGTYVYAVDALTKEGKKFVKTGNVTLIR
jgi:gliding motility-associated-like protein